MPNINENQSIGSMTNGWGQEKEKIDRVNQSLMTNTPSAFKLINGGEVKKLAAKTGYG